MKTSLNFNIDDLVDVKSLPNLVQQHADNIYQNNYAALNFVKDAKNLTEDQKFFLCLMAGVLDSKCDPLTGRMTFTTRYPCGIEKIEGKWRVFTNENL